MLQNLSSAAVVIGALRVNKYSFNIMDEKGVDLDQLASFEAS